MTEASRPPGFLPDENPDDFDDEGETSEQETPGTAADTQQAQQPTVDWESDANPYKGRHREAQSYGDRRVAALEAKLLEERQARSQPQVDPNDPLAIERARLAAERQSLEAERQWSQVRAEHPPEIIDAYGAFVRGYEVDPSPKGAVQAWLNSVMALAQATAKETPAEAPLPTRQEAVRPRVDTSRSEAPDPDAIDRRIAGAKERKDPLAHVRALMGLPEAKSRS